MSSVSYDNNGSELFGKLCYPQIGEGDEPLKDLAKSLYTCLKTRLESKDHWYILDAGAGGGWFTSYFLIEFLKDDADNRPDTLHFYAVDTSPGMLECFRSRLNRIGNGSLRVELNKDLTHARYWVEKRKVDIEFIEKDILNLPHHHAKRFDAIFCFFLLQHIQPEPDGWRAGITALQSMLKKHGVVVLTEALGDHACWSYRFNTIRDFSHLCVTPIRQDYIHLIHKFLENSDKHRWFNYVRTVTASDVQAVVHYLENEGFHELCPANRGCDVPCKDGVDKSPFSAELNIDGTLGEWLEALGMGEDGTGIISRTPIFSIVPTTASSDQRREIAKEILIKFWSEKGHQLNDAIPMRDTYRLRVLQHLPSLAKKAILRPEGSTADQARELFSQLNIERAMHNQGDENILKAIKSSWEKDLTALIAYEIIRDPAVVLYLHWSLGSDDWFQDTPIAVKMSDPGGLRSILLFYSLADRLLKHKDQQKFHLSTFVFQNIPEKAVIEVLCLPESDSPLVDVHFRQDGSVGRIVFRVDPITATPDFIRVVERVSERVKADISSLGSRPAPNAPDYDVFDNLDISNMAENHSKVWFEGFQEEIQWYDPSRFNKLNGAIRNAFSAVANVRDSKAWLFKDQVLDSLTRSLVVISLLGYEKICQYPSRDSVDEKVVDHAEISYEVSAGGIIVYFSENTRIDRENVLEDLLNLRNRASYLGQHKAAAVREVREHALRSGVAAIMARNMSHNIGSHPLDYLLGLSTSSRTVYPDELLRYIKERMDFIADVTTHWRDLPWLERLTS